MPQYQITAPDGNTYKIDGPAGASKDEIQSRVTAKFPQAAKPKDQSLLSKIGAGAKDVAGGLLNPKELVREGYHSVTDLAGHTLSAASDVADWIGDKTGLRQMVGEDIWTGHHQNLSDIITGKPNDYNLTKLIASGLTSEKWVREPQTVTGRAIKDISEFTLGMAVTGKAFDITNKTLQGGLTAWTIFDPQQQRLSDLVQKYPALRNPVTDYLSSKPGDSNMESRLKNALEGIGAGKIMDGFAKGLNLLRMAMRGKVEAQAFETPPGAPPGRDMTPTPRTPNASGESAASQEAVNRVADEKAKGIRRLQIDPDGKVTPLIGVDAVDKQAPKGHAIIQVDAEGNATILDRGGLPEAQAKGLINRAKAQGELKPPSESRAVVPSGNLSSEEIRRRLAAASEPPSEERAVVAVRAEMAGQAAANKVPNISEGISRTAGEAEAEMRGPTPRTPTDALEKAFSPAPLAQVAKAKLGEWWRWTKEMVAPGSVSPEAKQAESDVAKAYAQQMQHVEERFRRSPERKEFWETNRSKIPQFIRGHESPPTTKDPAIKMVMALVNPSKAELTGTLGKAKAFYSNWMSRIAEREKAAGIQYEEQDHYIPHLFEDEKGVENWLRDKGMKQAGFAKRRTFDTYEEAAAAGFRPRFTNPEDIFQARQHASDIALAKIDAMNSMLSDGLAMRTSGQKGFTTSYAVPNGETYWVHDDAKLLLNRMFDEKSLWSDRSPIGSAYRGAVALKNNLIPVRLAFSLFHPLHVLTMHVLAASATRSYKAGEWIPSQYQEGSRMLSMLRGEIPADKLSGTDRQALQYVAEGGLILEQDPRYRTQALEKLRTDFVNANPGALAHIHTGALQAIQNVVFKTWIPSLKGASYLADVRAALKAQPSLIDDSAARRVALRRIAKSVENRYGEMNYSTLFWPRMLRDVSVLSATSMGWQLGLFREYGGGAGQLAQGLGKIAMSPRNGKAIYQNLLKSGDLDKLIYIANYSTIAAVLGGLTTWAMTSKPPSEWMDYFAPKTGEQNADGSPSRVRTMFYPYEFAAMAKRVQNEGPGKAAAEFIAAKGTGIPSMLAETWTGVDSLGREIRDPNGTVAENVRQTLNAILRENTPISLQNKGGAPESTKQRMLDIAGLSRAPKYLQQTAGEAQIEQTWQKYYKSAETPFQQSIRSGERHTLQQALQAKDDATVNKVLPEMVQKYNMRPQDAKRMVRDASGGMTQYQALFKEMRAEDQTRILKGMDKEERAKYLQYAKRQVAAEFSE